MGRICETEMTNNQDQLYFMRIVKLFINGCVAQLVELHGYAAIVRTWGGRGLNSLHIHNGIEDIRERPLDIHLPI